ncbi:T7SS effector LXG polymorphic toxin [Listeria seeligeri]|uniref:T7SS effector LXG polymorphic toxin n=1 Tax=Listeria seeligeri TaxID=1640 RepID=UPI00162377F1|nr:T7SS effector LXG polymorphic toxin [Listeria seeligeri]MBC1723453.1 hypothetical protein [Listeria seeligeri]MBF2436477.1 hypothetical protein [Listeria seeligeri]
MSRIDIGEVQNFLAQLKYTNLQSEKAIQAIQTVVTNYAEDDSLKGRAIDASKKYYQTTYFSLCNALKEAMNESEERLTQYIQDFEAQVDSSPSAKIDAEGLYELGKIIDGIESKKEALAQQMNSGSEGTMQNYRSELATAYKKEAILEKYLSFEQGHGNFFDTLNELVQSIKQTVKELSTNVQFNSQTGTYDMSKLDIQSLERMHQALKKAKDNEETINFDDYQKTYQGHTWILMKDGKVDAEATDAYNEAILNGTLPHEANQAELSAEMLEKIIHSIRNGRAPLTGQEISKAQSLSLISGLLFYYTSRKYKGKKISLSRNELAKIKNSSNKYNTKIDSKVIEVEKAELPNWIKESYTDGNYRTVETTEEVKVYRTYGGKAKKEGGFATTSVAKTRIDAKIETALLPEWGNSRKQEIEIIIPEGTILNIGKVAPQTIKSTGTILSGGADQILLPQGWSTDWITNLRVVPSK